MVLVELKMNVLGKIFDLPPKTFNTPIGMTLDAVAVTDNLICWSELQLVMVVPELFVTATDGLNVDICEVRKD